MRRSRTRQGWTVREAADHAKLDRGTWARVEAGEPARSSTLHAVEVALGWPDGTAEWWLTGVFP